MAETMDSRRIVVLSRNCGVWGRRHWRPGRLRRRVMGKAVQNARSSRPVPMTVTEDFPRILAAAKKGDENSFAAIWMAYQPGLLRYLRVIGGQAADDLAADTWLQVTRKLTTFEGDDKAFRAWLYTIARHRHIDWRRQTTRRKESLVEVEVLDRLP